ncbi:FtsX-like permease family protein [Cellulomonas sp. ATA003]|uniref:FtsX-like permease family protein n=1 Tax=Cellulomonas sp. ATA003 TaxID=3073064 RepID=UPI0028734110|nr:FtsX-like permease family protein [Cellulomonas sp. ATA003]WNB85861.1 FtsX-like permease family protein [Cellulomonas sp. ATA003]
MSVMVPLAVQLGRAGGRRGLTTTALAVVAFAVTATFGLSVLGGLRGFMRRDAAPTSSAMAEYSDIYVVLAWAAVVLLLVPLVALGGAAARLGLSRRDARLATLRLLGVTPREVVGLTVLETAAQGLVGALLGIVGYLVLLPVWTSIPFQGADFTVGEVWVGVPSLLGALVAVPALAAVSGAVSLRRVVVAPLGVAQRTTPPRLRVVRLAGAGIALLAFALVTQGGDAFGALLFVVLIGMVGVVMLSFNALGPWLIGRLGRVMVRFARRPAQLLAGRRLLDEPRAAWRVVGGLGLAGFVAGVLAVVPVAGAGGGDSPDAVLMRDLTTGALLTLAIAFTVAAASAGIMQAASVLDRRREFALQRLAGVPVELFDAVRRREVLAPMVLVAGSAVATAWLLLLPLFGMSLVAGPQGVILLVGCLVGGGLLVFGATELSRPLLRSVLAETVVRAD